MKILIVDDDIELAGLLRYALAQEGYDVVAAYDGRQALARFASEQPDLVVLDVNLPLIDGYGVLAELRKGSSVPVLMLTVRATEADEVRGLDIGADDYLRKPFSPRALLARVRALLRRGSEPVAEGSIERGPLRIDTHRSMGRIGTNEAFRVSPLEMRLLRLLSTYPGRPVDVERILGFVWSDRNGADREALKQLVHRLRAKLQAAGGAARWIEYVPGAGYSFAPRDGPVPPD